MDLKIIEIGKSNLKIADGNYSSKYPSKKEFVEKGVPFIRANNFDNKTISDEELYFITEEKHSTITKGHLLPNDVLITTRGNIGEVALVPKRHKNSNINAQIVLLRCDENNFPLYVLYALTSDFVKRQIPKLITGTALKQLPVKKLKKLKIPLPSLAEQQRIAGILDEADKLRQLNKQLIAKYEQLSQSLFLEMFGDPVTNPKGWEKVELGLVTHMKAGKFISAKEINKKHDDNDNSYPCYGGNGLRGFVKTFTHEGEFILIGRQGALCGNVKLVKGVIHATEHAIVCSPKQKYENIWLFFLLNILNLNKYATGAAQPGLNVSTLVKIEVILPSYNLQAQFAARVQLIEQQKQQAQEALQKSENLFNALLQKAFKGGL